MFQRDIEEIDVEYVVHDGEIIESYVNDKPYASYLSLGLINDIPLHVVYAKDENDNSIIITVYRPTLEKWHSFILKTRTNCAINMSKS